MKILKASIIIVIFLVGAASLILYVFYKYNNKEVKILTDTERKNVAGNFIKLSHGVTHYQLSGAQNGPIVVLVHGFSVPYYIWDGTYEYLISKGYKVLRYDTYGRGYSDRPNTVYNKELFTNQLLELISQLKLQGKINLVGLSFGGKIVTDFTCMHPDMVGKVILIDPGYEAGVPKAPKYLAVYNEAVNSDERVHGQLTDFKYPKQHPNWEKQYLPQMRYKGFRNALVSTLYDYDYNGRKSNACLNSTNKPVLLIWGKDDKTVSPRFSDSIRSVLKVDFFPVTDAAHLPFLEKPDLVNPKIVSFLKRG